MHTQTYYIDKTSKILMIFLKQNLLYFIKHSIILKQLNLIKYYINYE